MFTCQVSRIDYGIGFQTAAKALRDRHGLLGFENMWGSVPFPSHALAALDAALAVVSNNTPGASSFQSS